jgi:hypothetical protein
MNSSNAHVGAGALTCPVERSSTTRRHPGLRGSCQAQEIQ